MAPLNLSNLPAAKSSDGNANLAAKNRDIMTKSPDEGAAMAHQCAERRAE